MFLRRHRTSPAAALLALLLAACAGDEAPPAPAEGRARAEQSVADVRAKLPDLRAVEDGYRVGASEATYRAWLDGDEVVAIRETRRYGDRGSGEVAFYFRDGGLVAYLEQGVRGAQGLMPAGNRGEQIDLALYFDDGRYVGGGKTVDGARSVPDEQEVRGAFAQAEAAKARVAASRALADGSLVGPVRYDCADGSSFSMTFDNARRTALLERPGRRPLLLHQQIMGSGIRYTNGANEFLGKGREATWRAAGEAALRCTAP